MADSPFNFRFIFKMLGILLIIEAFVMLLTAGVGWWYHEPETWLYLNSAAVTLLTGLILECFGWKARPTVGKHESFVFVTGSWLLFSFFGAIPFFLSGHFNSFTDAYFESMSGFSTTGSTILSNVEALSHASLFWRAIIQWLGGVGIVLFSLTLLPMMNGGFQLFTAEVTGPVREKIAPKFSTSVRIIWAIYICLTLLNALLLYLGPMDLFDAACHALTTMSTGGFSTKNGSIGYWHSTYVETVTAVFMFLGGTSFILIYRFLTGQFSKIRQNEEFRWYVGITFVCAVILSVLLLILKHVNGLSAFRDGFFHVISIITTTGFATANFSRWEPALRFILVMLMFCGAMSGSTSGNVKIARIVIVFKSVFNEMRRSVHPNAVLPVMYNGKALSNSTVTSLHAFFFLYVLLIVISTGLFFSMGSGLEEAFGISLTSIGNIGPGLGEYFSSFSTMPAFGKWWMCFLMMTGRLEIYAVLLLFSKEFWSK